MHKELKSGVESSLTSAEDTCRGERQVSLAHYLGPDDDYLLELNSIPSISLVIIPSLLSGWSLPCLVFVPFEVVSCVRRISIHSLGAQCLWTCPDPWARDPWDPVSHAAIVVAIDGNGRPQGDRPQEVRECRAICRLIIHHPSSAH